MNELLSICIPTFNRAAYLRGCLENLIPLAKKYDIPIYISDNASTDDSDDIAKEYAKIYPNVFYSKNSMNYGPDFNFFNVLKMSKSKYAWLMSDDDRLRPDAVDEIIGRLTAREYDLIVVNGGRKGKDARNIVWGSVGGINSAEYTDRDKLLSDLGWHMTWMSCLIFNRNLIDRGEFKKFLDTNFIQFAVVFHYLSKKDISVYWEAQPLVYNASYEIPLWFRESFEVFAKRWYEIVNSLPEAYSKKSKLKCIKDHGVKSKLFTIKFVAGLRIMGYYNFSIFRKYYYYFPYITNIPRPILLFIAVIPVPKYISKIFMGLFPSLRSRFTANKSINE